MSIPQVEHDGASPGNTNEDGERTSGEAVIGLAIGDAPAAWVTASSSLKEVLGLRYSDEMNLPPSQRAM
jgi:hypothetical protein